MKRLLLSPTVTYRSHWLVWLLLACFSSGGQIPRHSRFPIYQPDQRPLLRLAQSRRVQAGIVGTGNPSLFGRGTAKNFDRQAGGIGRQAFFLRLCSQSAS